MRLRNTSSRPTAEVQRLIAIATRGVRLSRTAVHVKNGRGSGWAYEVVPSLSPRARQTTVDRLITIRLAGDAAYPYDNMRFTSRWQDVSGAEYEALPERDRQQLRHVGGYRNGVLSWTRYQREIRDRHPYGGKRSPLIVINDWREALVSLAAHEARHIWQYQHNKPRSEVDCERFAARALERYRTVPA